MILTLFFFLSPREASGKIFSSPKNVYSKVLGNGLSSSFGDDSNDGMRFFLHDFSYSILNFHLLVSIDSDKSSKALILSKIKLKWINHYDKRSSLTLKEIVLLFKFSINSTSTMSLSSLWGCLAMLNIFSSKVILLKNVSL